MPRTPQRPPVRQVPSVTPRATGRAVDARGGREGADSAVGRVNVSGVCGLIAVARVRARPAARFEAQARAHLPFSLGAPATESRADPLSRPRHGPPFPPVPPVPPVSRKFPYVRVHVEVLGRPVEPEEPVEAVRAGCGIQPGRVTAIQGRGSRGSCGSCGSAPTHARGCARAREEWNGLVEDPRDPRVPLPPLFDPWRASRLLAP